MNRGIPQGSNASDFLANLFLYDIDREMIGNGHHYVRYVDDVRILGPDKPTVQRGLIRFDLELKRAGLVAQVSKTSVHKIEDIKLEINRLQFYVTNLANGDTYEKVSIPSPSQAEQAESAAEYVRQTPSDFMPTHAENTDDLDRQDTEEIGADEHYLNHVGAVEQNSTENFQHQLRSKFLESYDLLEDADRSREAESSVVFCINRMEPHETIRGQVIALLQRLPWRSEAVTRHLSLYRNDPDVIGSLGDFVENHTVYSWHRANSLLALHKVGGFSRARAISRTWLASSDVDWFARYIAAIVLSDLPGQHSFLIECLRREQSISNHAPEETAILRHQLAYGAFQRTKSPRKQAALLRLISADRSPVVRRLVIYLLQQQECRVAWSDLGEFHSNMNELSDLVVALGITSNAPRPCFITETLTTMYGVSLVPSDLRAFYKSHYSKAVEQLRESVSAYHESKNTNAYVRSFHQFAHLSLLAFYEDALPGESGLFEGYSALTDRKILSSTLPRGLDSWKRLGQMRNRVDHPIDKKTQLHPPKISVKEVEDIRKEFQVALQELVDKWCNVSPS